MAGVRGEKVSRGEKVFFSVRVPSDVAAELRRVSSDRQISVNAFVNKAVRRALDNLPPVEASP